MTLGVAIFASVVLILLVYNRPFRKVSAWTAGIAASLALISALGWYGYSKYQEHSQAKQAAAHQNLIEHQNLVEVRVARYFASNYYKDPYGAHIDVYQSCESNPNIDWNQSDGFAQNAPKFGPGSVIEIHGGETLKVVPPKNPGTFIPESITPILYLGHKQRFVLACGNYGEKGTSVTFAKGDVICP